MGVLDRDCNAIAFGDDGILENICKSNFNSVSLGFVVSLVAVLAAGVLGLRLRGATGGAASGDSRTASALAAISTSARSFNGAQLAGLALFSVPACVLVSLISSVANKNAVGVHVAICMAIGIASAALVLYLSVAATRAAAGRAIEASRTTASDALSVALRSGAVLALLVCAVSLGGMSILFFIFGQLSAPFFYLAGFALGTSAAALFVRVAGGIFAKGASMGAELVGHLDKDVPDMDARNPASAAAAAASGITDVVGAGADLMESYCAAIVAACILAERATFGPGGSYPDHGLEAKHVYGMVSIPFWVAALGVISSALTLWLVRSRAAGPRRGMPASEVATATAQVSGETARAPRGAYVAAALLTVALSSIPIFRLLPGIRFASHVWVSVIGGVVAGLILLFSTEVWTSEWFAPARGVARKSSTGPATVLIQGLGLGMLTCGTSALTVVVAAVLADHLAGAYGLAMAALGMLSTVATALAAAGAGGVLSSAHAAVRMSGGEERHVEQRVAALGQAGRAVSSSVQGFSTAAAALTAAALLAALRQQAGVAAVDLTSARVLMGCLVGAMLPFVFASLTTGAVVSAATVAATEALRQLLAAPAVLYGAALGLPGAPQQPDYRACAGLTATAALKELVVPLLLASVAPVGVGLALGAPALVALLAGALTSGYMLSVTLANAGGAWQGAASFVELGGLGDGRGAGSDNHRAARVGGAVAHPTKDGAAPALISLIKVMILVSLALSPMFKNTATSFSKTGSAAALVCLVLMLLFAKLLRMFIDSGYDAQRERLDNAYVSRNCSSLRECAVAQLRVDRDELDRALYAQGEAARTAEREVAEREQRQREIFEARVEAHEAERAAAGGDDDGATVDAADSAPVARSGDVVVDAAAAHGAEDGDEEESA